MVKVTFIDADESRKECEAELGYSLMEVAKNNGIEGIEADCGGSCACATCHVYVDPDWFATVGPPSNDEAEMLEFAVEPQPTSRLSCQIRIEQKLAGMVVRIPFSQH